LRRGPNKAADQTATPMTQAAVNAITAGPDVASASGPAIRIGIRLAALTIDARTPKTRPLTASGMFSNRAVCADTIVAA